MQSILVASTILIFLYQSFLLIEPVTGAAITQIGWVTLENPASQDKRPRYLFKTAGGFSEKEIPVKVSGKDSLVRVGVPRAHFIV
jgi:hypothetical protein